MRSISLLAAAAALSMAAAPAISAPANPAAQLSLMSTSDQGGGAPAKHVKAKTLLVAGVAVAAVVATAVALSQHDSKAASA